LTSSGISTSYFVSSGFDFTGLLLARSQVDHGYTIQNLPLFTTHPTRILRIPSNSCGLVLCSCPRMRIISCCSTASLGSNGRHRLYSIRPTVDGANGLAITCSSWPNTPRVISLPRTRILVMDGERLSTNLLVSAEHSLTTDL